jgi:N-acetylmuramoyl-L-alanine amidase
MLAVCLALAFSVRAFAADPEKTYREALREFKHLTTDAKAGKSREKWQALDKQFVDVYRRPQAAPWRPRPCITGAGSTRNWPSVLSGKGRPGLPGSYQRMIDRYPRHEWADDAYVRRAVVLRDRLKDNARATAELRAVLKRYPDGDKTAEAVEMLRALDPSFVPETPKAEAARPAQPSGAPEASGGAGSPASTANLATPSSPAQLSEISKTGGDDYSRITLSLDRETTYRYQLLDQASGESAAPRRLYIDLDNVKLGSRVRPDEKISDGILRQIRAAYNKPTVARVVLDIDNLDHYKRVHPGQPFPVVLDVYAKPKPGKPSPGDAAKADAAPKDQPQADPKAKDKYDGWLANLFRRKEKTPAASGRDASEAMREETAQAAKEVAAKQAAKPAASSKGSPAVPAYKPPPGSEKRIGDLVEQLGLTVRTIMIDAGHGGKDPGAQGLNNLVEKDVNLRFARVLGKKLEDHGFEVLYTRTRDVFIPLEERTAMANAKKADLFLSIHCNAHGDAKSAGLEIYSLNLASTEDAVRVAARENAVSAKTISDLQLILTDLMLNTKMKESRDLARTVQDKTIGSISGRWKTRDRGTHEAPFYVLMGARMPAVLVEMGYITNPNDAKRLASDNYLEALAQGMVNGVVAYKQRIERFTGEAAPASPRKKTT